MTSCSDPEPPNSNNLAVTSARLTKVSVNVKASFLSTAVARKITSSTSTLTSTTVCALICHGTNGCDAFAVDADEEECLVGIVELEEEEEGSVEKTEEIFVVVKN